MRRLLILLVVGLFAGCGDDDGKTEVWIYSSIYPQVIERLEPKLDAAFPDVRFRWFQKGSEQIAARLNAEFASGDVNCDLLMTSDPFYYAQLAERGLLLPYESPQAASVPVGMRANDHAFTTVRVPVMVIAVNHERFKGALPASFRDLVDRRFDGKLSMGDPLKSGTNFTTVAALSRKYGWDYFQGLRKNDIIAAGGNSAVLHRLETGERPVGIVLLENLLPRLAKGAPITVVYPTDGAVPVPSPIAILKSSPHPELARRVYDLFFSTEVQASIVSGHMYSPLPEAAPPVGARAWKDVPLYPWNAEFVETVRKDRDAIKRRFREIMKGG
ncbi:MAG: ABC transporter substrate-binding protein [Planctomycetes bacterium]|nr:ABC transporter substrate-binding protein [Planctomycetota bacterium]